MYVNDQEIRRMFNDMKDVAERIYINKSIKANAIQEFLTNEAESSKKCMELAQELLPLLTRESVVITNKALRIAREASGRSLSFG